jgi:hypothetical protein
MRLALMVGHIPGKVSSMGPVVSLPEGNWRVNTERVIDTILHVESDSPVVPPAGLMALPGPCKVRCIVDKPGSEPYINVFAERI